MWGFVLVLTAGGALFPLPIAARAQMMPPMTAYDLNAREIKVPGGFNGSPAVLIVAFEREQQREIDRVTPFLEKAKADFPRLEAWELPVIENPGSVGRFVINRGMKTGIPDENVRSRVVTLYVEDRKAWMKALGLPQALDVYVVVGASDGAVLGWKAAREITDAAALTAFLNSLPKERF